jgi:hypothetical protein
MEVAKGHEFLRSMKPNTVPCTQEGAGKFNSLTMGEGRFGCWGGRRQTGEGASAVKDEEFGREGAKYWHRRACEGYLKSHNLKIESLLSLASLEVEISVASR